VIDEFTSVVDRTVAQIASCAVAKAVRRLGQAPAESGTVRKFVAVACHYDILEWLNPDWVFDPALNQFTWRLLRRGPDGQPGRPPIELDIRRVNKALWRLFGQHHYLSHKLAHQAQCFAAYVAGRPAAFTAVIHCPHANGGFWREHRTVCLPDFQGAGIGNALSEMIASGFVCLGKKYSSTTSHPGMIGHRSRSPLWTMIRKPSFTQPPTLKNFRATFAGARFTASFQFIGPPNPEAARTLGIWRLRCRRADRTLANAIRKALGGSTRPADPPG